jgi:hypothetical protein
LWECWDVVGEELLGRTELQRLTKKDYRVRRIEKAIRPFDWWQRITCEIMVAV